MDLDQLQFPFKVKFSIASLLDEIKTLQHVKSEDFSQLIDQVSANSALIDGVDSLEEFEQLLTEISPFFEHIMPKTLLKNSLKAVSFPMSDKFYFPTDALKELIDDQGINVKSIFDEVTPENFYKICCCFILYKYYNVNLVLDHTNLLEVDNGKGYLTYLTILYNFEYIDINPIDSRFELDQNQIDDLLNNYDDSLIWQQYFPPNSWEVKGIVLATLFDNTANIALSNLKSKLLTYRDSPQEMNQEVSNLMKSIFKISDLEIGFSFYDETEHSLVVFPVPIQAKSILLGEERSIYLGKEIISQFDQENEELKSFVISNLQSFSNKYPHQIVIEKLIDQGYKSLILFPLRKNGELLGILEIASRISGAFNRINANFINEILPLIEDSIFRFSNDLDLQVNSYIQTEYTSLHPSVEWKFKKNARSILLNSQNNQPKTQISFKDIYPFYGEIDVRGSSAIRNQCMRLDYGDQLNFLIQVCEEMYRRSGKKQFVEDIEQLNVFLDRIENVDKIYFERELFEFITLKIHPEIPNYVEENDSSIIADYLKKLDPITGLYYVERKKFDTSIFRLNKFLSQHLDSFQQQAQRIFPHYYERFKTDGIDFNLYLGQSIAPNLDFSYLKVKELRVWQLQSIIKLEQDFALFKDDLSVNLSIASLVLATNFTLDILFKMDEKRFDVDGYNNAKYEIIKKRINKSNIKGTQERINVPGKLCIVYTEDLLKDEYTYYLKDLIKKGDLLDEIEYLEIEDLQGVSGLFVIRVPINYSAIRS